MRVLHEAVLARGDWSLSYDKLAISNTYSHAKNRNDPRPITLSKVAFLESGFSAVDILGGSDGPPCISSFDISDVQTSSISGYNSCRRVPGCVQLVWHNHDKLANIIRLSQSILKNLIQSSKNLVIFRCILFKYAGSMYKLLWFCTDRKKASAMNNFLSFPTYFSEKVVMPSHERAYR